MARLNHVIPKNLVDFYNLETEFPFRKAGRETGTALPARGAGSHRNPARHTKEKP
jgi:hypothetical protein